MPSVPAPLYLGALNKLVRSIEHLSPEELAKLVLDKYKIWTVALDAPGVKGLRITPNIYTTTSELDKLVEPIRELSS